MTAIKIISDPYKKETCCKQWENQDWTEINRENNPNSNLVREKIETVVFPFKAKEILDAIIQEYYNIGCEPVKVIFQGTNDEYNELSVLCKQEAYSDKISLHRAEQILHNAHDILPQINEIFRENISPVLHKSGFNSDQLHRDIKNYEDASNDVIPLCVMGNYSSGKSTFINALIGSEILPSGEDPLTAKVFKIRRRNQNDSATVLFHYLDEEVTITFNASDYEIGTNNYDTPFFLDLYNGLDRVKNTSLSQMVSTALDCINKAAEEVDDLIELEVPFYGGLWDETDKNFVIFDTPGSNTTSNKDHIAVLEKVLEGFSNGLSIFVSERDDLDSDDNRELIDQIAKLNKMDKRFTMIVVNKADAAQLPKEGFSEHDIKNILNQTLTKEDNSGIYFVSSVMGLGAKIDGEFTDDYLAELYEGSEVKFSNPKSRFYKTLYKYNILPEQIKSRSVLEANQLENLIYANSGLYTLEKGIHQFAENYAAYDKCTQATDILKNIIGSVTANIDSEIAVHKNEKITAEENITTTSDSFSRLVQEKSNQFTEAFKTAYPIYMREDTESLTGELTVELLKKMEASIEAEKAAEKEVENRDQDVKSAWDKLGGDLGKNALNLFTKGKLHAIWDIGKDLVIDVGGIASKTGTLNETKKAIDKETAAELIGKVKELFKFHLTSIQQNLLNKSKCYCKEKTEELKAGLIQLVAGSEELSEENSAALQNIILEYVDAKFDDDADTVFTVDRHRLDWNFDNWFGEKLDLGRIHYNYTQEIEKEIRETHEEIHPKHIAAFELWAQKLTAIICDNIKSYSTEIRSLQREADQITEAIQTKETLLANLQKYHQQIKTMMDWQNA